jgi:hypothetical protein
MVLVLEEVEAREPLLVVDVLFLAVREDHVVDPLERAAGHRRVLADQVEIVLERARPVELGVLFQVLQRRDLGNQRRGVYRGVSVARWRIGRRR